MKHIFLVLGFSFLISFLSACAAAVIASNATVSYLTEDRKFGDSIKDNENEISLRSDLFQQNHTYPVDVSLVVSERRLLIVGNVDSQNDIDTILEILWKNPYITKVYNHLTVKKDSSFADFSQDVILDKKVWAYLIGTQGVTTANYKTLVHNKTLYILGSTSSQKEKTKALNAVKNVSGLREIVEYIIIL